MIKKKINQILTQKLDESNSVDYKVEEYSKSNLADFLKDTIAFLNSEESYKKDKFIIFGVANKNNHIVGLKKSMRDDNEYQDLLDKITPRPEIISGTTIFEKIIMSPESSKRRAIVQINLINKSEQAKYKDKSKENIIEFENENNNGNFTVGNGNSVFVLGWYVVYPDVAHIRAGNGEEIGYVDNYTVWPPKKELNYYSFSSSDRRISKNESFILVNKLGKILGVRLLSADSKSHGAIKDRVKFEYKCLN